ncbi:MAG: hypothetical protein LKJ25_00825 [Clostridia bacterium]|nr:hypothetical protein [Clostridia bacterium]
MKKFALSLAVMLMLSGCGTSVPSNSSAVPSQASASSAVSSQLKVTSTQTTTSSPLVKSSSATFPKQTTDLGITVDSLVSFANPIFEKGGFGKLSEKSINKETLDDGTFAVEYELNPNVDLIFYENEDGKNITNICVFYSKGNINKENLKAFIYSNVFLENYFESGDIDSINDKLNLDNITENNIASANGENVSFSYIVDDNYLNFLVSPLSY